MEPNKKLLALLGKVFDAHRRDLKAELPAPEYEQRRHDFVFHMTDWLSDLRGYAEIVEHPGNHKKDDTLRFLIGFLYHVVPHLNAAGRLLLDHINDPFAEQPEPHLSPAASDPV